MNEATKRQVEAAAIPRKGMVLSVYRSANMGDCTNGGESSWCREIVLVGSGMPELFPETPLRPAFRVRVSGGVPNLIPALRDGTLDDNDGHGHYMFGGNFAYTSDSRFRALWQSPLAIHDRTE